jgi:hypothetical protein
MIFNKDLKLKYKPIKFTCTQSHFSPFVFDSNNQEKIFALLKCDGTDEPPRLYILDYYSQQRDSLSISNANKVDIFTIPKTGNDLLFYYDFKHYLHQIDDKLGNIRRIKLNINDYNRPQTSDLNNDGLYELIFKSDDKVWITDETFYNHCMIKANTHDKFSTIYIKKAGSVKHLGIRTEKELQFFKYESNPWFLTRYLFYLFIFLVMFFLFWTLLTIYRWRLFSKKLIQVSADDAGRGILRLDTRGRIKYIDTTFSNQINSDHHIEKNEHFLQAFNNVPVVKSFIQKIIRDTNSIE